MKLTQTIAWSTTLAALLLSCGVESRSYPSKWDNDFKRSVRFYMPYYDWRLLKAQCIAESNLDPLAVSPVGAQGLCQFMPKTWRDMKAKDPSLGSPFSGSMSIRASAAYMNQMFMFWTSSRPFADQVCLAQAGYNAGAGNILKAQKLSADKVHCQPILCKLPEVTGHHSKETISYVKRINSVIYPRLLLD